MPTLHSRTSSNATHGRERPPAATLDGRRHDGQTDVSDVTLLLKNLRLLDLDQRKDWPDITLLAFSTKDAQQNQRHRIRCVEWVLFRLFELWDPDETRNKLQPFFPPLEPLQSLNLRAALYRNLSELKKNGLLGRDTVLRKSMLDECKGERFEEILLAFSAVVVRRRLPDRGKTRLQKEKATDGYALNLLRADHNEACMEAVILAYRALLTRRLNQREDARARYQDFTELIGLKSRQIARREEQSRATSPRPGVGVGVSDNHMDVVTQHFRSHWIGGPKVLDLILGGDVRQSIDRLLSERFDNVWDLLEHDTVGELEDSRSRGHLEDIEETSKAQARRLAKWKEFRERRLYNRHARNPAEEQSQIRPSTELNSLKFDKHQMVNAAVAGRCDGPIDKASDSLSQETQAESAAAQEYERLMQSMKVELDQVGKSEVKSRDRRRHMDSGNPNDKNLGSNDQQQLEQSSMEYTLSREQAFVKRGLSSSTEEHSLVQVQQSPQHEMNLSGLSPKEEMGHSEKSSKEKPKVAVDLRVQEEHHDGHKNLSRDGSSVEATAPVSPKHQNFSRLKKSRLSLLNEDDQELLAKQIVSAATASGPSPVKVRPSLTERTRMSMAFNPMPAAPSPDPDDVEQAQSFPPGHSDDERGSPVKVPNQVDEGHLAPYSIVERTRQSLSAFPKLPQAPTNKHQRRISRSPSKKPAYPSNPFTTPRPVKQSRSEADRPPDSNPSEARVVTPKEDLFDQGADYASVFKSRPKIATSPSTSPIRDGGSELPGFDDLDNAGHQEADDSMAAGWADSPLARLKR